MEPIHITAAKNRFLCVVAERRSALLDFFSYRPLILPANRKSHLHVCNFLMSDLHIINKQRLRLHEWGCFFI